MKAIPAPDRAMRRTVIRAKVIHADTLAVVVIKRQESPDLRFLCSTAGNWRIPIDGNFVRDLNAALKQIYEAGLEAERPDSPFA